MGVVDTFRHCLQNQIKLIICFFMGNTNVKYSNGKDLTFSIWSLETSRDILHYKMLDKRIFISAKAKDGRSKRINVVTLAYGGKYVVFVSSHSVKMRGFSFLSFLRKVCLFLNFE